MPGDRARIEARASEVTKHGNSGDDKGGRAPGLLSILLIASGGRGGCYVFLSHFGNGAGEGKINFLLDFLMGPSI